VFFLAEQQRLTGCANMFSWYGSFKPLGLFCACIPLASCRMLDRLDARRQQTGMPMFLGADEVPDLGITLLFIFF
jgi:hypothetical protein